MSLVFIRNNGVYLSGGDILLLLKLKPKESNPNIRNPFSLLKSLSEE
jgi:hypothetical protein